MIQRLSRIFPWLLACSATAWADRFHRRGATDPVSTDPQFDAFVWSALLIIAVAAGVLLVLGPLLVHFTRRIRYALFVIPAVNILAYGVLTSLRRYPGGFLERFSPPGLWYTMGEVFLLLLVSFSCAVLLAVVHWLVLKFRSRKKKSDPPPV